MLKPPYIILSNIQEVKISLILENQDYVQIMLFTGNILKCKFESCHFLCV